MNFLRVRKNPSTTEALAGVVGRPFRVSSGSRALDIQKGDGGFIRSADNLGPDYGYETRVVLLLRTGSKAMYALNRKEFDVTEEIALKDGAGRGKILIRLLPQHSTPPGFARVRP